MPYAPQWEQQERERERERERDMGDEVTELWSVGWLRIRRLEFDSCLLFSICYVFNDVISSSDYIALNDWLRVNRIRVVRE
jgi:hypothetical protein